MTFQGTLRSAAPPQAVIDCTDDDSIPAAVDLARVTLDYVCRAQAQCRRVESDGGEGRGRSTVLHRNVDLDLTGADEF